MGFEKGILVHHLREGYPISSYTTTIRSRCHILLRLFVFVLDVFFLSGHNEMVRKLCHEGELLKVSWLDIGYR